MKLKLNPALELGLSFAKNKEYEEKGREKEIEKKSIMERGRNTRYKDLEDEEVGERFETWGAR